MVSHDWAKINIIVNWRGRYIEVVVDESDVPSQNLLHVLRITTN
jgi:hypothetical protein